MTAIDIIIDMQKKLEEIGYKTEVHFTFNRNGEIVAFEVKVVGRLD